MRSSLTKTLLVLFWAFWLFAFVKHALIFSFTSPGVDYVKHYHAAQDVLQSRNPFVNENGLFFAYPQFAVWLFLFLAWFSPEHAEHVWDGLNALFLALSLGLVIAFPRPRVPAEARGRADPASRARVWTADHWPSAAAFIMGIFAPAFVGVHCGNIEPLNLFLGSLLCLALLRNAQAATGAALAVLSLVKILPSFFVVPLWLAGKRRTVAVWAGVLCVYALVLIATGWWRWEWFLFTETLPNLAWEYRGISNSLVAIAATYFFPWLWSSKTVCDAAGMAATGTVLALCVLILLRSRKSLRRSWRPGLAFASLSIVLATPLLEYIHLVWTLPAYLFLILDFLEGEIGAWRFLASASLWILVFACRHLQDLGMTQPMLPRHIATFFVLGLWILAAADLLRRARKEELRMEN